MDSSKAIVDLKAECFDYVRVFSNGIWNVKKGETILQHSFVRFQLQLLLMVSISHFFHLFFRRFHFPRLTSDVLAGMVLGPTFLERCFPEASVALFPPIPNQVFASLLKIGYILFTFLAGVRTDTTVIKKSGKKVIILALLIFAFPYTMTQSIDAKFDPSASLSPNMAGTRLNNVDLVLSQFVNGQFVDTSAILIHLKISNSRLGHLALAASLLSDILRYVYANLVISFLNRLMYASSVRVGILFFIHLVLYMGLALLVARRVILWFIRMTPEGKPIKDIYIISIIAAALVLALVGDGLGMDLLLGPLVLGLIIPAGSPLAITITNKLDTIVSGLLIPLLSTFCASRFDLWLFLAHIKDVVDFQISLIGYSLKLIATVVFSMAIKINFKEAVVLAHILNVKGPREMGTFLLFTPIELRDLESTSGIFLVFLITTYATPLIKMLYDPSKHYIGYKKKCVQYTSHYSKLEILACASKQEEALSIAKLLQISNPSKDSPLTIYGLCLEELLGSDTPYVVDHKLGQKKSASKGSQSQPIIDIFNYFMSENKKGSQVHVFTAVSPLKSMHEDICWQAFDKTCSFIVLPFHQKWNSKGKLVSNNNDLRNLNINVLERAPCSIGILIDRSRSQGLSSIFAPSTTYHVAILFIGGEDDREALAYALRMAGSRNVQLTVVCCLTPDDSNNGDNWDDALDHESLRQMKHEMSTPNDNINYVEETVKDGSDTANILRSLQGKSDLILVGRRHKTQPEAVEGLSEWTEFPELGPIGDLLATSEDSASVAILVVQQQITKASHSNILN